jgi:hypothetical protein
LSQPDFHGDLDLPPIYGVWFLEFFGYSKARESRIRESLLTDPFDCSDMHVVGILGGIDLTLARVPMGMALIFAGAASGPTIASEAGVC